MPLNKGMILGFKFIMSILIILLLPFWITKKFLER